MLIVLFSCGISDDNDLTSDLEQAQLSFEQLIQDPDNMTIRFPEENPTALQFEEYLSPRIDEHAVIIEASGTITGTDQKFTFGLTHRADQIEWISLVVD